MWRRPDQACMRVTTFLQQWQLAKFMVAQPRQTPPSYNSCNRPLIGMYKCNIDATFSNNKIGIGMCLRDNHGHDSIFILWFEHSFINQ